MDRVHHGWERTWEALAWILPLWGQQPLWHAVKEEQVQLLRLY